MRKLLHPMRTPARVAAVAGAAALLAAGCGSSSGGGNLSSGGKPSSGGNPSSSVASQPADNSLAAMVPADIKADGTITIGSDTSYAPSEFIAEDGKTIIGFDVDLFDAVAQKLGLKTTWVSSTFDNIIPSVLSGKYELGISSFTINADRMKATDMLSYFSAGTQWATAKGNPKGIQPDNACGHRIAVQKGTVQVDDITARAKKCKTDGKPGITIDQYLLQNAATAALVSGKDEAMLADSPVIAYAVKQTGGRLDLLGDIYDSAPYGYVFKKGSTQFEQAVQKALEAIIADGTYKKVLDKWGVAQGAITSVELNPSA